MASTLVVTGRISGIGRRGAVGSCASVDGGKLVYGDFTKYDTSLSYAVNQWNSLHPINVKADTASTYADVDVSDCTFSSDSRAGWFDCSAGVDDIKLNSHPRAGDRGDGPVPGPLQPDMNNNLQSWDINSYHSV